MSPPFRTIYTNYGQGVVAAAQASGIPINLTEMAVGDGDGVDVSPKPGQSSLVREMYRASVNQLYHHPDEPNRFVAELAIPAAVGGFVMREVGLYDDAGGLFAVGNIPPTYKPEDADGAFSDALVRVEFIVSDIELITLQIDPNVTLATQQWVINNLTAATLIPGGTTGQVLTKVTNSDGDYIWSDPTDALVVVDTVAEKQTLAAAQTVVTLSLTVTYGLAVYVEGLRLSRGSGADEWEPDPVDETRFTLGQSYPDGSRLLCVNNEPAGSAPAPLEKSKNLSDVPSKATARQNLEIYSKEETDRKAPPGTIIMFAGNAAPAGWLKCNGAAINRTSYAQLFTAIGTVFGPGDGFTTFNIPDLRGEFIRGWDDGRGVDSGRAFGSFQSQQVLRHQHMTSWGDSTPSYGPFGHTDTAGRSGSEGSNNNNYWYATNDGTNYDGQVNDPGVIGNENRPRNRALLFCIKF